MRRWLYCQRWLNVERLSCLERLATRERLRAMDSSKQIETAQLVRACDAIVANIPAMNGITTSANAFPVFILLLPFTSFTSVDLILPLSTALHSSP